MGTRIKLFLAISAPLRIASGTSLALPSPAPTRPWPSPTTTSALKLNRRPPLTTLATRLILMTRSSNVIPVGSIFGILVLRLELQAAGSSALSQRLHTSVIEKAAAIEDHLRDSLFTRSLSEQPSSPLSLLGLRPRAVRSSRRLQRGSCHKCVTGRIVDDLSVDMLR